MFLLKPSLLKQNFKPSLLKRDGFLAYYCFSYGNFVSISWYIRNIPYLNFLVTLNIRGVINDSNI